MLTNKQIERQDLVDNEIFQLLNNLNPTSEKLDWNIEFISEIREVVMDVLLEHTTMTEMDFYPYEIINDDIDD